MRIYISDECEKKLIKAAESQNKSAEDHLRGLIDQAVSRNRETAETSPESTKKPAG